MRNNSLLFAILQLATAPGEEETVKEINWSDVSIIASLVLVVLVQLKWKRKCFKVHGGINYLHERSLGLVSCDCSHWTHISHPCLSVCEWIWLHQGRTWAACILFAGILLHVHLMTLCGVIVEASGDSRTKKTQVSRVWRNSAIENSSVP